MFTWERPKTFLDLQRRIKAERRECRRSGEILEEKRGYVVYRKALAAANKIVHECYPV